MIYGGRADVGNGRVAFGPYHGMYCALTIGRDVAAGIAIVQEAGGLVTTANPPKCPETAEIEDVKLGSRLYLAIR